MIDVSEDDFLIFEEVRASSLVNMADIQAVEAVSGLDQDIIRAIIRNYVAMAERYLVSDAN